MRRNEQFEFHKFFLKFSIRITTKFEATKYFFLFNFDSDEEETKLEGKKGKIM